MKCISLLLCITIFGGIFHYVRSTCVLESNFGFIINCAFKKSGLFRVRNLGGVKAHIGLGFSLGDELGFKESISNTEINRRRSAEVSKMQAQLIQATQKQQEEKKAKLSGDKTSRAVSNIPVDVIAPLAAGAVVPSEEVPPFKPIPPAAERPAISKINQPSLMGIAFSPFNAKPSSISRFPIGNSKISIDPSVMAVIAVPKKKLSSDKPSGFADRVLSTGDDKPVPQHSSNSLQNLLATNNVTDEALELALLQHQQSLIKRKKPTTTTTTTRRPVTSKRTTSVGKVMNAPKEYYPVGYDKNFDDNFAARVDLPDTSFYCGDQKHFPGLYADEDLGCMVFHVCALTDEGLIMKSFLCPESTLFDQAILKCNWWFYVDCKNSKKLYDSNIPISKSYQLMKALTFFSAYKKESSPSSSTSKPAQD